MTLIILLVVILFLFGGWSYSPYGVGARPVAPYGISLIILIIVLLYFVGGARL